MNRELTPGEHTANARIEEAARWLAANRGRLQCSVIEEMQRRFGLTAMESIEAHAESIRYEFLPVNS